MTSSNPCLALTAAALATPQPDVAGEHGVVVVFGAADVAPACVRRVLLLAQRHRRVVDAEGHLVASVIEAQCGDRWVVGVQDERGVRGEAGNDIAPAGEHRVDLAVAVELITEEVEERDDARLQGGGRVGEHGLVDLEHCDRLLGGVERAIQRDGARDRRVEPAHEVGARAVVGDVEPGLARDLGDHRRGGRLAIGAGDHDDAALELMADVAQQVGRDALGDQPGERGAPAATQPARDAADRLRGGEGDGDAGRGAA